MFSGLIEAKVPVVEIVRESGGIRLTIRRPASFDDVRIGDSIAIQGCCLTVIELDDARLSFQAGIETLSRTTLGRMSSNSSVNCERSLRLGDRLGGHLVTGHVDGMGRVADRRNASEWSDMFFEVSPELALQMASKGSVTVDGVSLTLVDVTDGSFSVALIPHTLAETTLGSLQPGDWVNIETDLLAKYVGRQLSGMKAEA